MATLDDVISIEVGAGAVELDTGIVVGGVIDSVVEVSVGGLNAGFVDYERKQQIMSHSTTPYGRSPRSTLTPKSNRPDVQAP